MRRGQNSGFTTSREALFIHRYSSSEGNSSLNLLKSSQVSSFLRKSIRSAPFLMKDSVQAWGSGGIKGFAALRVHNLSPPLTNLSSGTLTTSSHSPKYVIFAAHEKPKVHVSVAGWRQGGEAFLTGPLPLFFL